MDKKILVLATGAIGSCIGADLTRAGRDVILADQWPAHVEAMKTSGVRTITKAADENTAVKAVHLCEIFGLKQMFDLVLLTAKSYDSVWLTHLIKPHLKPDGLFVSIQNSLNDELTAPIVGHERNIACVVELSAEIFEPGIVKRNTDRTRTWFAVGELHGRITPRLQELSTLLSDAGKADMTTNIWGAKWSKLAVNCMTQSPVGILGIHEWEAAAIPSLFDLCIKLGRECLQVGSSLGYTMEPIFGLSAREFLGSSDDTLKKILTTLLSHIGKDARNSMLQDHLKGRKSEVDQLNGLVAQKGMQAGIPTPLNDAMVRLTRRIETGALKPGRGNLSILEKLLKGSNLE